MYRIYFILAKKIVHQMDFKYYENIIKINSDKSLQEKLSERSVRLKKFQIRSNILLRLLKKNDVKD